MWERIGTQKPLNTIFHNQLTDTSSPSNSSSTTIVSPAAPNVLSDNMERAAWQASSRLVATTTPFPAANPLALTTKAE